MPRADARSRESARHATPLEENVAAIQRWEQAAFHSRSRAERFSDSITELAASGPVQLAHVAWFAFWLLANTRVIHGLRPFDPFPFPLLTMIVSLEAIFLALFVLASQNRLSRQADRRAALDLQIDLLAEREMPAVLQLRADIARHLDVKVTATSEQLTDLTSQTDIHKLTDKLDALLATERKETRAARAARSSGR